MRYVPLAFLLFAAPLLAENESGFETLKRQFDQVRTRTSTPGGHAQVVPVVEALVETGDARVVSTLAPFLVETYAREAEAFKIMKGTQRKGATAHETITEIDRELQHLRRRERAGDAGVGPRIQKLVDQRRNSQAVFESARMETARFGRLVEFLRELREDLAVGLGKVMSGLDGAPLARAFSDLRAALDVTDREQGLFLVRILSDCGKPEAEAHLLAVMAEPKAPRPVVVTAIPAIAKHASRNGGVALLKLARREEGMREHVLHALGLAAGRRLETIDAAQKWLESLP